jgi:serine/threonine protein kinase
MSHPITHCQNCGKPLDSNLIHGLCPECFLKVGLGSGTLVDPAAPPSPGAGARTKGFVPPASADLAPHFPQLEVLDLAGKGGMGAVYRARQKGLDRLIALKVLPSESGGDAAFAERFSREGRALARLNHPNIVAVFESGQAGGFFYFLMEYVDGVSLRQMLRAHRLSPREAMAIVPQICEALQYAHDQGIVHRDIKPENVLIDKQGRVKIADFGLAKLLGHDTGGERLTQSAEIMGTPQYMSPEQVERPLEVDHRADIYSLGVVFYEMLTGELPMGRFAAPSRKVHIDVRLDEIVLRALEKEPELRFQQASQMRTGVESITATPQANVESRFEHWKTRLLKGRAWFTHALRSPEYLSGKGLLRTWAALATVLSSGLLLVWFFLGFRFSSTFESKLIGGLLLMTLALGLLAWRRRRLARSDRQNHDDTRGLTPWSPRARSVILCLFLIAGVTSVCAIRAERVVSGELHSFMSGQNPRLWREVLKRLDDSRFTRGDRISMHRRGLGVVVQLEGLEQLGANPSSGKFDSKIFVKRVANGLWLARGTGPLGSIQFMLNAWEQPGPWDQSQIPPNTSAGLLESSPQTFPPDQLADRWGRWSPIAVDAIRAEGRPVLVNFTADWCITSKANIASLEDPDVVKKIDELNVAIQRGDYTVRDPEIEAELVRHDRVSVPLTLLYPADPQRPAEILPEVLTPEILLQALNQIPKTVTVTGGIPE